MMRPAWIGSAFLLAIGLLLLAGGGFHPAGAQSPAPAAPAVAAAPAAPAAEDAAHAGLLLFNDPSISGSGKVACATCHPRGGHTDNKSYVGLNVVKDGTPEGRSVPLLWGAKETGPYSWAGGKTLKENIKGIIVNRMKGKEPTDEQLGLLIAYIDSLEFPANPNLNADGTPSASSPEAAKRGYKVFMKASCNACHVPPVFAKSDNEDIGSGGSFSVPSLRGLSGTAPYFHDGRFQTLREVIPAKLKYLEQMGSTEKISPKEIEDLLVYLNLL